MAVSLKVNGTAHSVTADLDTPLLYVLRNDLGLNGAKFGCGLGQCGACTVLVDGAALRSCIMPIGALARSEITTLEGLGTLERPHPLQSAFIAEQAAQCGYCIAGIIMMAKAILDRNPHPSEADVRLGLVGNLCRCGSHNRIVRAISKPRRRSGEVDEDESGLLACLARVRQACSKHFAGVADLRHSYGRGIMMNNYVSTVFGALGVLAALTFTATPGCG